MNNTISTSTVPYKPSQHCDLRGKQRGISVDDLKRAKKYGVKKNWVWPGTVRYDYEDVTYIVKKRTGESVTAWAKPVVLNRVNLGADARAKHLNAQTKIFQDRTSWTSHSVFVVDTSGSMRESDIWGTRTRLSAVWLCLARDYIGYGLNSGEKDDTDVVTVITLCEAPTLIIENQPWTWTLYNKVVSLYRSNAIKAESHGPFLPALQTAHTVLVRNDSPSQAAALYFLSDGVPSDTGLGPERDEKICQRVKDIASLFGRRLTFVAVGIGAVEHFCTLEKMVDTAKDFGVRSEFLLPSMTADSLGSTISSALTSLSQTQSEMSSVDTLKQRAVRRIMHEGKSKASVSIAEVSPDEFFIYPKDRVVRSLYHEWFEGRRLMHSFETLPLQSKDAHFIALSKCAFDSGGERYAFRFYEIAADGKTIVGPPMVAKESLYVLENEENDLNVRKSFVRKFCSSQQLAIRLAKEFNKVLDSTHRVADGTARIEFLDCSIYELDNKVNGKQWVLVEKRLDVQKWQKWNWNNGMVEGMSERPTFDEGQIRKAIRGLATLDLGMIDEGDEDEESSSSGDIEVSASPNGVRKILFKPFEVAQAFSHFTYWATKRKRLVCDLQGVFQKDENVLKLSDPAIHYYDPSRCNRRQVHGETDKGGKGFYMFFETHKDCCNRLCKLTTRNLRPRRSPRHLGRSRNIDSNSTYGDGKEAQAH